MICRYFYFIHVFFYDQLDCQYQLAEELQDILQLANGKIIFKALFYIVPSLLDRLPDTDCDTETAYFKIGLIIDRLYI